MTQLRDDESSKKLSNYFDRLETGIGHRGSSPSQIDSIRQDGFTNRALVIEYKYESGFENPPQERMYRWVATRPGCTAWRARKMDNGTIELYDYGGVGPPEIISESEYQSRVHKWWNP